MKNREILQKLISGVLVIIIPRLVARLLGPRKTKIKS